LRRRSLCAEHTGKARPFGAVASSRVFPGLRSKGSHGALGRVTPVERQSGQALADTTSQCGRANAVPGWLGTGQCTTRWVPFRPEVRVEYHTLKVDRSSVVL
jgi:hypothetical protein